MILVTGANGLLGSFLCNQLADEGRDVVALVRKGSNLSLLNKENPKLQLQEGDILDIVSLKKLFESFSVEKVVHAAAVVSFHRKDRDLMEKVNVEGTINIVNICLQQKVKKLVHVSSVAALGRVAKGTVSEKTPWINSPYHTTYTITKHAAEMEVWRAQTEGLNTVIINPSLILAAADGQRSSSQFFSYLKKEPHFYPTGNLNYVDIRDVTNITIQLMDSDITNERFILNAGTVTYKDFFILASKAAGLKAPSIPVKKNIGRMALIGEYFRSKLLKRQPMLTSESLMTSRRTVSFDNKKITNFLNYQFLPLSDSINWVWEQYNSAGRIEK